MATFFSKQFAKAEASVFQAAVAEAVELFRLEVDPLGYSYDEGLAARVADPLWMLARQWQFREFDGEDAGSPLTVDYRLAGTPLLGWAPGAKPAPEAFKPIDGPLEALVEAEPVLTLGAAHPRLNAEAGRMLLRLAADAGFDAEEALLKAYPAKSPKPVDELSDPAGMLWHLLLDERSVDAATLAADLRAAGGAALPQKLADAGLDDTLLPVLADWQRWFDDLLFEQRNDAWLPRRQEYAFELAAGRGTDERWRLDADEYVDGRIDWHDFDLRSADAALIEGDASSLDDRVDRRSFATPVQYPGMPATRYWEFEDGAVTFARLQAGPTDIVRLMMAEYALVHGND